MNNGTHPLYNVIARIPGTQFPDEWILYGNHHDAWVDGASDPLSGASPRFSRNRRAHWVSSRAKAGIRSAPSCSPSGMAKSKVSWAPPNGSRNTPMS